MDDEVIKGLLSQGPFVAALAFLVWGFMKGRIITGREADDLHAQINRIAEDRDKWRAMAEQGTGLAVRGADVVEQSVQKAAADLLRGQKEAAELLRQQQKTAEALRERDQETAADLLRRAAAMQQVEDREKGIGGT